MKLSVVAVIAATAGLAQVSAAPLRLLLIGAGQEDVAGPAVANIAAIRFGHSVPPMATVSAIGQHASMNGEVHHHVVPNHRRPHGPCGGMRRTRFRQKAIDISNAIRKAFGLPLIEHPHRPMGFPGHGRMVPGPNGAPIFIENGFVTIPPSSMRGHVGFAGHPHPHHFHQSQTFLRRLHLSLMNLGPWEGRAVAFVLGCGIGVLLRMIWVLFIVGYRAIKGPKPEEHEYAEVIFIQEEHEIAPPSYPVDVKIPIEDVKTPVEEAK